MAISQILQSNSPAAAVAGRISSCIDKVSGVQEVGGPASSHSATSIAILNVQRRSFASRSASSVGLRELRKRSPACVSCAKTSGSQTVRPRRLPRGASRNSFDPLGFGAHFCGEKLRGMATMTVPRALVEDTSVAPPVVVADLEAGAEGYGTFDMGEAKALQDESYQELAYKDLYVRWNNITARLADSATFAFLLLQLPQIVLNTQNLLSGNYSALFAIPWMGQLTGLLGNLSLLSYFAGKRERGAMLVQAVGVVSTLAVLVQLNIAGAMPSLAFSATATAVVLGLSLNLLNYHSLLPSAVWRLWEEAVSVGGITVLPQVMWSTFQPYLPPTMLPAIVFGGLALSLVVLNRLNRLPEKLATAVGSISAWTATALFMWAPVSQMWLNILNPTNIQGLSVFTVLLAMIGNGLLFPRALFTRDLMWFTGASWGFLFQGWGILLSMYSYDCVGYPVFWTVTAGIGLWISGIVLQDSKAYDLPNPLSSVVELLSGSRR